MEILVLSDSHGRVDHMVRAVEQFHPRQVLHLGDCVRDAQALERQFPQLPVTMVPGNCDWGQTGEPERLLEIEGVRILMMHGHTRHVKSSPMAVSYTHLDVYKRQPLAGEPLRPLGYFRRPVIKLAERVGFEPTDAFTSPVFKTGAFDHSAISPFVKANLCQKQIRFYHPRSRLSTQNARSRRINISRRSRGYFLCGQSPICQPSLMRRWYGLTSAWDLLLAARKRA